VAGAVVARAAGALLAALVLGACGGGGEATTVTVTTTSTETAVSTVTATVTTTATTTVTVAPDLATRAFQLPSGNIGCLLAGETLRCDIRSGLSPEPAEDCDFDWVGLTLGATGPGAPLCGSDTVTLRGSPTLAYGSTWGRGGILCESSESGLSCANREGHEFTLARGTWSVS
jgi:hypothetical protein